MNDIAFDFTRIILDLDRSTLDRSTLRFAAEFAKLLRLSLHGLFAQDPRLASLAGLPPMREFRVLERQWRPVEGRDVLSDIEIKAAIARKTLDEIAEASGVSHRFEILSATAVEAIASVSCATDIVMVAEPRAPAEEALHPISEIVAAAMATPASILLVPSRIAREHGPILAVAETSNDPIVTRAAAIAAAAQERLATATARDVMSPGSRRPGERMIVMSRRICSDLAPASVAARRQVPVLILGAPGSA